MTVSIITATYNSDKTVRDTLESVKKQTYSNIEHIIVDGLSSDRTLEVVAEFPHVAKVHSGKDKGIYDAMNKGLELANGEIIGILNSDDFYPNSEVIEKVVKTLNESGADTIYADLQYVHEKNTDHVIRNWNAGTFDPNKFYRGWMPPHPTFFVRREVYEQFGKFDLELKSSADYEIMLRFLLRHKVSSAYLPETTVKMRTGGQSNRSLKNRIAANFEDRKAWEKNGIKPKFYSLFLKPFSKIGQYF